jgi:hypothetical protein
LEALVGDKPMNLQLASAMVLATDVVKVFNPQSPPARAIFDLAIVVIAVMVVILRSSSASRGKNCGTARQLLVSDSGATVPGYFFLDFRAPKKCNETATKGEFNEMKSRIGTLNHLVAATCAQSAAGRRERKAKM